MEEQINKHFGKHISYTDRVNSYDFLEKYIEENVPSWDKAPDTEKVAAMFADHISKMDDADFCFLLCHTGYIPEFYGHDSSQETLYSKLIEVLVCEWAIRIGFTASIVQKQKASKEDITIKIDNILIVSDAKSYRLGRSQAAPNVKDIIKKADYEKWQSFYANEPETEYGKLKTIGGLITFPSLHGWKKGSDAFLYASDGNKPILILFYEHMSFYLLHGVSHDNIVNVLQNFLEVFPSPTKQQEDYFKMLLPQLFGEKIGEWDEFSSLFDRIIKERVFHVIRRIDEHLEITKKEIRTEIDEIPVEELKANLVEAKFHNVCGQLMKQLVNIKKFRPYESDL